LSTALSAPAISLLTMRFCCLSSDSALPGLPRPRLPAPQPTSAQSRHLAWSRHCPALRPNGRDPRRLGIALLTSAASTIPAHAPTMHGSGASARRGGGNRWRGGEGAGAAGPSTPLRGSARGGVASADSCSGGAARHLPHVPQGRQWTRHPAPVPHHMSQRQRLSSPLFDCKSKKVFPRKT
jgi:hypothetical protein